MKSLYFAILLALLLVAGDKPKEDSTAAERQKLAGEWKVVAAEMYGKALGEKEIAVEKIVFESNRVTLQEKGKKSQAVTYLLAPQLSPRGIELVTIHDDQKRYWRGIYELDDSGLKLCLPMVQRGKEDDPSRPESFDTKGKPHLLLKAQRERAP